MWPLSHCRLASRQVGCIGVVVGIAKQNRQTPPKVPAQMVLIEIKTGHAEGIIDIEIWQHVPTAVCGDCQIDGRSLGKGEIPQHILGTG